MAETDLTTALKAFPEINVSLSAEENKVSLKWTKVQNAEKYEIKKGQKAAGPFTRIDWAKSPEFTDTVNEKNAACWYKIVAHKVLPGKKTATQDSFSTPVVFSDIPAAKGLTVAAKDEKITLSWNKGEAESWFVYRKSDDFSRPVFLGEAKKPEFTDTTPIPGQVYHYFVQSLKKDEGGKLLHGNFSSEADGCYLNDTQLISLRASHGKSISVSVRLVCGCDGYILERSEKNDSDFSEVARTEELTQNALTDKAPSRIRTYYYRARAYKLAGEKIFYGEYCPVKSIKAR